MSKRIAMSLLKLKWFERFKSNGTVLSKWNSCMFKTKADQVWSIIINNCRIRKANGSGLLIEIINCGVLESDGLHSRKALQTVYQP